MDDTGPAGSTPPGPVLNTGGQPPSAVLLAWAHQQGRPVRWLGHPDWRDPAGGPR